MSFLKRAVAEVVAVLAPKKPIIFYCCGMPLQKGEICPLCGKAVTNSACERPEDLQDVH